MKILLVHIFFTEKHTSGVNPIVYKTYDSLKKKGNEVYIFSLAIPPYYDENYKYTSFFPEANSYLYTKKSRKTLLKYYINSLFNFEALYKINQLLNEIKPNLVHIHTMAELSSSIILPIKLKKIPIIYSVHDISEFCPASFNVGLEYCSSCAGLNTLPCVYKKCVKKSFKQSLYVSLRAFIHRICGTYRGELYLTVSQATKNYMIEMGIKENKISVLPNFISDELISITNPNYSRDTKYFLYAGGANKVKGIYTLLDAVKTLPDGIELHIAGGGVYDEIENIIKENKLSNVKILGSLTKEQMQEEYKNCIAVIMPSELFETFGMINIEAAVYGKPSISSNIGGLPDIVEDGKTGLIFEPKNVEQLKNCILTYWNNRNLAIEHGKAAREKAVTKYNQDLYFKKLTAVYESFNR